MPKPRRITLTLPTMSSNDRPIADKLRDKLTGPAANDVRRADLHERIEHLKAARRPNEPATIDREITAEWHIASAITSSSGYSKVCNNPSRTCRPSSQDALFRWRCSWVGSSCFFSR